jgi:L-2-amino-thiazoline-4-carboxylic acid hydrolase
LLSLLSHGLHRFFRQHLSINNGGILKLFINNMLTNLVGKQFLRHLAYEAQKTVTSHKNEILKRTHIEAQELFEQHHQTCPDIQSRIILKLCCLVLASYRVLVAETDNPQTAYLIIKGTVGRLYQGFGRFMFLPLLWLASDPVKTISNINWKKWNQLVYGEGMEFDQEVTSDRVTLIVNRCAFHQFFVEQGEPRLTQAFCAWDRLWMDVIDDSNRPVRTERPTTISTGADCCQFQCVRDMGKTGKASNDVILEQ